MLIIASLFLIPLLLDGREGNESAVPPVARIISRLDTVHGDILVDDYYWLRDRNNPEVIEYLNAENKYAEAMMNILECYRKHCTTK